MKDLSLLSKQELLHHALSLAEEERKLSLQFIACLRECEKRFLHLDYGCSSLWSFSIEILKLSEASAQRYISSMRLGEEVPEAKAALEAGALTIANASTLQSFFYQEKKKGEALSLEEKRSWVEKAEGLSKREVEKEILKVSPKALTPEREKTLTEEHTELRFVISSSVMKEFEKLKSLLSHRMPNAGFAEIFEKLVRDEVKRLEIKKAGSPKQEVNQTLKEQDSQVPTKALSEPSPAEVGLTKRQAIPAKIRRQIWNRSEGKCEYISPQGKRCNGRRKLEFDHFLIPVAKGGRNSIENIRIVCRSHQLHHAVKTYGKNRMQKWI